MHTDVTHWNISASPWMIGTHDKSIIWLAVYNLYFCIEGPLNDEKNRRLNWLSSQSLWTNVWETPYISDHGMDGHTELTVTHVIIPKRCSSLCHLQSILQYESPISPQSESLLIDFIKPRPASPAEQRPHTQDFTWFLSKPDACDETDVFVGQLVVHRIVCSAH